MASGAHHGAGNPDYAGHDFRRFVHVGNRPAAGVGGNVDHCAGPVGRCTRSRRRWDQARTCRWPTSCDRGVAGSDQAGDGNLLRNAHKYHRLPAVPSAQRKHGGVPQESSHRDDSGAAVCAGRCDDVRPVARLLHSAATEKERANGRGKAPAGFLWFLQPFGRSRHTTSVVGAGRLRCFLVDWGLLGFAPEATIFSRRRPVLVLPRHLVAERCALNRNKRCCTEGRASCASGC